MQIPGSGRSFVYLLLSFRFSAKLTELSVIVMLSLCDLGCSSFNAAARAPLERAADGVAVTLGAEADPDPGAATATAALGPGPTPGRGPNLSQSPNPSREHPDGASPSLPLDQGPSRGAGPRRPTEGPGPGPSPRVGQNLQWTTEKSVDTYFDTR